MLWYVSGSEDQISLQYVGEVKEPATPWLVYICAGLCATFVLLLCSAITKYIFCREKLLAASSTLGTMGCNASSSLSVIEAVYSTALLDATYVFNKPSLGIAEHTFSTVDTKKLK